jgi:hypothetical protein
MTPDEGEGKEAVTTLSLTGLCLQYLSSYLECCIAQTTMIIFVIPDMAY